MNLPGRRRRPVAAIYNPNRDDRRAVVASAQRLTGRKAEETARLHLPWQARAFFYYDTVGEIKYASQFYARMLAPLRLYAAVEEETDDGTRAVVETTNEVAVAALDRIRDPGGGRANLLASYGRLMFLIGECYLFVSRNPDTELEQWEMLSPDELQIDPGGRYSRRRAPSLTPESYRDSQEEFVPVADEAAVAYRLWRRHPRFSSLPDAPMQAVLDIAEELLLLTQGVRARVRSRLAGSGILLIDERIDPPPLEPAPDEELIGSVFGADLTEAMTTPLTDEGTASAVVPLIVRVSVPEGSGLKVSDLIHHLQVIDPTQYYPETGLREEAVKRLAIGFDMPPEILLGYSDADHWSAWLADENAWKGHGQPIADQFVQDLSAAYFRPQLRELGVPDWQRYLIAYDATAVVNHPNKSRDAKDLYDRRAIGKASLRRATAFDDEDAMTEEELNEALGVALRDPLLATKGVPSAPAGGQPAAAPARLPGGQGEEVTKAPPEAPQTVASANGAPHIARLCGVAEFALLRAREAAGNRLRSFAKRDPEAAALLKGVRAGQVAAVLGRDRVAALGAPTERELVAGARELAAEAVRGLVADEDATVRIVESVEQHAARTLYEERPPPLPPAFTNYVSGLMHHAG